MNINHRALILAILALAAPALAQQPVDPKDVPPEVKANYEKQRQETERKRIEAANAINPPKPVERPIPSVKSTDPDVQALVKLLTGTFASPQTGDTPPLTLSTNVITVDGPGVDNAVYFELARADSTWAPFHQGVWQVWKKNGNLMVRQYDFTNVPAGFKAAITGLWSAPDMFPILKTTQLAPTADISLTLAGGNYSGSGSGPSLQNGAFEFSTSWIITPDSLSFTDRGTDAAGKPVWGPAQGAAGPTFKRSAPAVKTERRTGGVVVMDFVPPSATERKLEDYGEAAAAAVFYTDTGIEIINSNTPGRTGTVEPFHWSAASPQSLKGLDIGAAGITTGTIRHIYIPSCFAFGPRAFRTAPPNSDIIVSLQTQWVGEAKPPVAPGPSQLPAGVHPPAATTPIPAGTPRKTPASGAQPVADKDVPPAVREAFNKQHQGQNKPVK